jgi:RNA polymerase sigma factor (sigma-70 family)
VGQAKEQWDRAQIAQAVHWVARRRAATQELAEEAVQEALLQLVQRVGPPPRNFAAWIRHVAELRLIDADRHRRTQIPSAPATPESERAVPLDLDTVLELRLALRRLEPATKEIVLRRLSGASWRELAATTGLGEEAVRKRFERGLAQLRGWMDGL